MNLAKFDSLRVLVTGADGFIPSYVCERLADLGADVTALVRRNSSNVIKSIPHLRERVRIRWGDITDLSVLIQETRDVDVVYHMGAQSHVQYSLHNPLETYQTNTVGTMNVLEAARLNDVGRVVHAGSAEVYGKPETVPIKEAHPLAPRSPYAAGKVASDRLMFSYFCTYGLPVVMSRFFGIFGPRQSIEKAIPKFVLRIGRGMPPVIYGDGTQSRDYMYGTDAADAYARLGVVDGMVGETVNIGTGKETRIVDLASMIMRLMGKDIKPEFTPALHPGEAGRLVADPTRGMEALDWHPEVSLEDGMKRTIKYYQDRPDLAKDLDVVI